MRGSFLISGNYLKARPLTLLVSLALQGTGATFVQAADSIQFNTDVLDISDRTHINLSQFSRAGYIMPGDYQMIIRLNQEELPEQNIRFLPPDNDPEGSQACLTPTIVSRFGFKAAILRQVKGWHNDECLDIESLTGVSARADLGTGTLYLNIPQAYLEYTAENWDPPSRWDDGIAGFLFDYNVNAQSSHYYMGADDSDRTISGYGTTGFNLDAWRFRADWQGMYNNSTTMQKEWRWNRYYAYRAIPTLKSKLMLGENYLDSGMFDSFRYTGASLISDDNMLPPNLRGYAPEVTGVARTNAKVTISQQGRIIYETTVASGPFRIQDLNTALTGKLDVKVQEQDGSEQNFQVDTANIPYLTRPGMVRYKVALGKPSDYRHQSQGPGFVTGEFSWGINNGWSLYGGNLFAGDYNALALGIGRDLLALGALSFDVTGSQAVLPGLGTRKGGSYRLSYSKRFEHFDSQVTFAGYRFSQRNFMNMNEFLDARYRGIVGNNNKELYTLSFNKYFTELGLSSYVNYSHQTYWNRPDNNTWNISFSRYFDAGHFKNLSLNLSGYRTSYNNTRDEGMYVSLNVPWGNSGTLSYDSQFGSAGNTNTVGYYDRIDNNNTWRIKTGVGNEKNSVGSGYFTHQGDVAEITASASYQSSRYRTLGFSMQGGATATRQGVALHRVNALGGTRMMVDSNGVSGVPIHGFGGITHTNRYGKAVISDINSYYRNNVSVDITRLADNVEATRSEVQGTLTEGAIGYRKFNVIAGEKGMVMMRQSDGSAPPFGAVVINKNDYQTGIVNDGGQVWLTGMNAGETMQVVWDGKTQCQVNLPESLPSQTDNLQLACTTIQQ
ncbi:outer membrane usher protein [Salmonella enterica]